jgi:outer membrane protein assembly factor BamB
MNVWDDSYPSGGNYWSNYAGTDLYSGPYQNITGSDGIGDTPYIIDANNRDNYPLMQPYPRAAHVDWWPMFHHDLSHSGYSTSTGPTTNNTIWNDTIGWGVGSSPAVADGKVYVGSDHGNVYCLDALTGAQIWNFTTKGWYVDSSPAVADGKVYIGSDDGNIYCLDALTGAYIWSYATGSYVFSSPAVADDRVYVGSWLDWKVYCLDALTGAQIWNFTTGNWTYSSPAVADGKVYIGSLDKKVYCLDAFTGASIWNYTTGDEVWSSPAVADGKVYIGSFDGKVYCLDALTGASIWNYTTDHWVYSSPAVADGKVYAASDRVYCLDALTGAHIWSYTIVGGVGSSPAVADGKVYIGSPNDGVYAFGPSLHVHDVAVTNVASSKTAVGQGFSSSINVTVANQGDFTEAFNVTAFANATIIGSENVTLIAGNSTTVTFTWNTAGFAYGNYTLSAYAWPVPGETDTSNNQLVGGQVLVSIPGDIKVDGTVDIFDAIILAGAYNSKPGDPNWNPNAEINGDNIVDIYDAIILANHYNQRLP